MIRYFKIADADRAHPVEQHLSPLDAANLQLRLVHEYGAVIVGSSASFTRYRAGAFEHVFEAPRDLRCQQGLEGLALFDPTLADSARQPSLF